jgi:hypothetical protein
MLDASWLRCIAVIGAGNGSETRTALAPCGFLSSTTKKGSKPGSLRVDLKQLSSSLFQGRQHVLPECVDKAQLPPPHLVQVDFGEPHIGVLGQPRSVLSEVCGDQD